MTATTTGRYVSCEEQARRTFDAKHWQISGKRRLVVSEFKGNTMINIREYYEKDGKALPGKVSHVHAT